MSIEIGIGSRGWRCEGERRVYTKRNGFSIGPLSRAKWRPVYVVGETARCWLCESRPTFAPDPKRSMKVDKAKAARGEGPVLFDGAAVERVLWAEDHRHTIGERIRSLPVDVLARVAEVIGYEVQAGEPRPDGTPWLIESAHYSTGQMFDADGNEVDVNGRPVALVQITGPVTKVTL